MSLKWWIKVGWWCLIYPRRRAIANAIIASRFAQSNAERLAIGVALEWWQRVFP